MSVTLAALPAWVAILPLGGYVLALGWIHLLRRPVVVPGMLDLAVLAAGLSGLVLAGPLALMQPAVGTAAWPTAMLLGSVALIASGGLLATRPRLVVYNVTLDQLRPILAEVVRKLDASARWAGESVVLPARGLQVLLDGRGLGRSVSLVAVGTRSSPEAWTEFARRVRRATRKLRVRPNPWGAVAAAGGIGLVAAAIGWSLAVRPSQPPPAAAVPTPVLRPRGGAGDAPAGPLAPAPGAAHARACRSLRA